MPGPITNDQVMLVERRHAAIVAEFTQADEIIGEARDDVAGASPQCWYGGYCEDGRSERCFGFPCGGADCGLRGIGVDVEEWCCWRKVVVARACVSNCSGVVGRWVGKWATG